MYQNNQKRRDENLEFLCPDYEHDISSVNIRHQFIRGLFNETLQTDILAKASQLKTVEAVVNHAEAFEAALRDQSQLSSESHVSRVSEYRKNKNNSYQKSNNSNQKSTNSYQKSNSFCNGCGSSEHGVFGKPPHNTNCPAWGKSCFNCKLPNHTATVCRKPAFSNSLIATISYKPEDYFNSSHDLQEIPAKLTPDVPNSSRTVTLNIFPDSGANICLAGPNQVAKLKLCPSDLRACNKRVKAVGGAVLSCTG